EASWKAMPERKRCALAGALANQRSRASLSSDSLRVVADDGPISPAPCTRASVARACGWLGTPAARTLAATASSRQTRSIALRSRRADGLGAQPDRGRGLETLGKESRSAAPWGSLAAGGPAATGTLGPLCRESPLPI